jgi:hypothetical protein
MHLLGAAECVGTSCVFVSIITSCVKYEHNHNINSTDARVFSHICSGSAVHTFACSSFSDESV